MEGIEEWFSSVETGDPFDFCKICEISLPLTAPTWVVNKHYHRNECILEYALCEPCRTGVSDQFSPESKAGIRAFLETGIDWESRILEWTQQDDLVARLAKCISCETSRDTVEGYSISAQLNGNGGFTEGALPLLMCSSCVAIIAESLSPASRRVWTGFLNDHFEGPGSPEFDDLGFF